MAWDLDPQYNYRVSFLLTLAHVFIPPYLFAFAAVYGLSIVHPGAIDAFGTHIPLKFVKALAYISAVPVYWTIRVQWDRFQARREASAHGAVLVPEVPSFSLGGLDIIRRVVFDTPRSYAMMELDHFFDEVGSDTVNIRMLWQDYIFTRDHKTMQVILATSFDQFGKSPSNILLIAGTFKRGIFATNGETWKAHRQLTRPFFARERITDFDIFDRYANKVVDLFKASADRGQSIDVQDIFGRFTLDAAGQFLFGTSDLNTLDAPKPAPGNATLGPKGSIAKYEAANLAKEQAKGVGYSGFVNAFDAIQVLVPLRVTMGDVWPLFEMWDDVASRHNRTIDEWVKPLVDKALKEKRERGERKMEIEEGCLTDHLCDATTDRQTIRDELMNILLAARDTTSSLLTFAVYALSQHPEVMAKLREEVLAVVPQGAPSYQQVKQLKYLKAVLNETLRLFPNVPANERSSKKWALLPSNRKDGKPYYIRGGDVPVRYSVLLMQRRKDLWGEDANEFKPERWTDPKSAKEIAADPFKFLPFNAGPRICLGQEFKLFTLRQAEDAPKGSLPTPDMGWDMVGGRCKVEKIWPKAALTIYSQGGAWVKMTPA